MTISTSADPGRRDCGTAQRLPGARPDTAATYGHCGATLRLAGPNALGHALAARGTAAARIGIIGVSLIAYAEPAHAQDADTAQQLNNPLASFVSIPLQNNIDFGGTNRSSRYTGNLQPVLPVRLGDSLNLITRTIVPFIDGNGSGGMGPITESLFVSPAERGGLTYGLGPVLQLPTATQRNLGSPQLGIGPTAVVVQKQGPILLGLLVNQVWGITGPSRGRNRLDTTFMQPFASYTFPSKTTLVLNTETSYDWTTRQWTVPVNLFVNQLVKIGEQAVQFGAGLRYIPERPAGSERWGIRLNVTLVFPTGPSR